MAVQYHNWIPAAESAPLPYTDSGAQSILNRYSLLPNTPARVWEGWGREVRHVVPYWLHPIAVFKLHISARNPD